MAIIKYGKELMIGADPEFMILESSGNEPASVMEDWTGDAGDFSQDGGCSELGELRPTPGSPREVTENIRTIIRRIRDNYPNQRMVAGGGAHLSMSAGGHIHFNICSGKNDSEPPSRMVPALDFYLGRNLQAMNGGRRRTGCSYGSMGDCRVKDHGFEYRTPPSFIADPILTEAVFAVAFRIAEIVMSNSRIRCTESGQAEWDDYESLIPVGTPFEDYYRIQIENFRNYVLGGFDLKTDDVFERWLSPIPVSFRAGQEMKNVRQQKELMALEAQREREALILKKSTVTIGEMSKANPLLCDVTVEDMSRRGRGRHRKFATYSTVPEATIRLGSLRTSDITLRKHRPKSAWMGKIIRAEPNVVYISSTLKGMFRIRRDNGIIVKYVDIIRGQERLPIIACDTSEMSAEDIIEKILHRTRKSKRQLEMA